MDSAYFLLNQQFLFCFQKGFHTGIPDVIKENLIDLPDGTKSANPEDYTDENIQRTMKRHQYYLQALLYQVALLRMLKLHYPNQLFPTEMLGEIAYVFLRAIDEEHPGRGVCSISFSPQLIEDVDAFLSNQNRN